MHAIVKGHGSLYVGSEALQEQTSHTYFQLFIERQHSFQIRSLETVVPALCLRAQVLRVDLISKGEAGQTRLSCGASCLWQPEC